MRKPFSPLYCGLATLVLATSMAAAQTVNNGNFESGFTDGVANSWSSWKSYGYTQGTFADGTDQYQSPSHSQKFICNQPTNGGKKMAIYQVVNVANNGTYTISFKQRSWIQYTESYGGEHIKVELGLDPTGGTYIHSCNVEWHELSDGRNTWHSESEQVTAESCWTTIYIRVERKFDYGGGNGAVWADDVTISGPTPENTYTMTPTVTYTNTPPTPVNGELVTNGNFESAFTNGLGAGWTSWSTSGSGYWKQSTLIGPAGGGNYANDQGWYEDMCALNTRMVLLCDGGGAADMFANEPHMKDSIIVSRWWYDWAYDQIYNGDWQAAAEWLADKYEEECGYHPRVDTCCGVNEPDWGTDSKWERIIDFETYFTQLMHQRDLKTVVLNMSVGSPGDMERILWCEDLFEIADYFGYHSYGGPNDQLMIEKYEDQTNVDNPFDYALRCRHYAKMYKDRGWRFPPVIYTEGTTYGGWHGSGFPDANDIRDDMISFIPYMNEDKWCAGLAIFDVGGNGAWEEWNIVGYGIADDVGDENAADPSESTDGLYSQQFGVGTLHCNNNTCSHDGVFTGGIVQAISGLQNGESYGLDFSYRWEHANGTPSVTFKYGLDWTGQTSNPSAGTINWSSDLISTEEIPHDTWSRTVRGHHYRFESQGTSVSLWFKASQNDQDVSYRISLDSVSLRQVSGTPPPTSTPAPPTNTPLPTNTPVPGQGLLNGDMEDGFTNGVADEWTKYVTNGSPTFSDGTDQKHGGSHSQKIVYPQPSGAGYAGLYQNVSCSSSQEATLSAYKYDITGDGPWDIVCRLGYDLTGGTNPSSSNVTWAEFDCTPHETWIYKEVEFTTTGSSVTIFIEAWHKGWGGTHTAYLDDVELDGIGGPAATSTNTDTPTSTATNTATNTPTKTPTNTGTNTNTYTPVNTPTNTPAPTGGLKNGNMEGGFTSGVANDWYDYCTNGSPTFSDGTDQKHGGSHSQKIVYPEPATDAGYAGIYQSVACSPSEEGTLTAWKYDVLSGSDPYALVCRLGYDLSGGVNPQSEDVVWSEFSCTPHESWISKQVEFTTTGTSVTVFVEAWHKGWNGTHTAWLDDVTLTGVGGGPTNTPANTATNTPTNTVTNTPTNTPTSSGPIASEDFGSMPSWSSSYNAGWGSAATWKIRSSAPVDGNHLWCRRQSGGSSAKVKVYSIPSSEDIEISIYMKCPSMSSYWMECAYKFGNNSAQNFDSDAGSWTMIKKFDGYGGQNGNGNTWTQYSKQTSTGSNTQISIGYKLGSSGTGTSPVYWDIFRINYQ